MDHPFIVAPVLASGAGADAFAGRVFSPFVITFKRVGRRILWVEQNTDYSARARHVGGQRARDLGDGFRDQQYADRRRGRAVRPRRHFGGVLSHGFRKRGQVARRARRGADLSPRRRRQAVVRRRSGEVVRRTHQSVAGERRDSREPRVRRAARRHRRRTGRSRHPARDALLDSRTAGGERLRAPHRGRPRRILHYRASPFRRRRRTDAVRPLHRTLEFQSRTARVLSDERDSGAVQARDPLGASEMERRVREDRHSECGRGARSAGRPRLGSGRRALLDRPLDHERRQSVRRVRPARRRSADGANSCAWRS